MHTSDTRCVTALQSYTAIQRYTALYIAIQLNIAVHYTTSTTPLWLLVVVGKVRNNHTSTNVLTPVLDCCVVSKEPGSSRTTHGEINKRTRSVLTPPPAVWCEPFPCMPA